MKNLTLIVPVLATFIIACDDTTEQVDVNDTTQTSREISPADEAFAQRAAYVTRSAVVVDIASRAARLQHEAMESIAAMNCDIQFQETLSATDGSCDALGDEALVIDINNCETEAGDQFDISISVSAEGISSAFALASSAGMSAQDFLASMTTRSLDIQVDTGSDYSIFACGHAGESGLKGILSQDLEIIDPDGGYTSYALESIGHGIGNERANQHVSLQMTDSSNPQSDVDHIDLSIALTGNARLTPQRGVAKLPGAKGNRLLFRQHLSNNNSVLFQSPFRYQSVVEIPML